MYDFDYPIEQAILKIKEFIENIDTYRWINRFDLNIEEEGRLQELMENLDMQIFELKSKLVNIKQG